MIYYFAYGSNMSIKRLQSRVPSATAIDIATLYEHELKFHKHSTVDNSAKCDAKETNNIKDYIIGVVFELAKKEKYLLDHAEGLGQGYETKDVEVFFNKNKTVTAFTYYATLINPELKPYLWYKEHVVRGAIENNIPKAYINKLKTVQAIDDPDLSRHEFELSLYHNKK